MNESVNFVMLFQTADEEKKNKIVKYLIHCGTTIEESTEETTDENGDVVPMFTVSVPETEEKEAGMQLQTVLAYEKKEEQGDTPKSKGRKKEIHVSDLYQDAEERAQDFKSSGIMLLSFAFLFAVFAVLNFAGVIQIMASTAALIILAIATVVFLYLGISSLARVKSLTQEAKEEHSTTEQIMNYLKKHFPKDVLDAMADDDLNAELLYFKQSEAMKEAISAEYPDAQENYVDALLEDYFNSLEP